MTATLPRVLPSPDGKPVPAPGTADVFRAFAGDLAVGRRPWTAKAAAFITDQFDQLAADWDTTRATGRDDPLRDAIVRGGPLPAGPCLELGPGTDASAAAVAAIDMLLFPRRDRPRPRPRGRPAVDQPVR
ncbi:hypothetical protein ACFWII_07490 [Streptomyces sp. NPDC127063]|uniref:hypothetical protein n=1 Tax=Streptomyces sp. NPDC127063 TaxID=3347123 RepID=UPI00366712D1